MVALPFTLGKIAFPVGAVIDRLSRCRNDGGVVPYNFLRHFPINREERCPHPSVPSSKHILLHNSIYTSSHYHRDRAHYGQSFFSAYWFLRAPPPARPAATATGCRPFSVTCTLKA